MGQVAHPWETVLTPAEHDLILFGLVAAALALLATLVRVRFTSSESHGGLRVASLTANAVVAIAFVSYLALILVFALGYTVRADGDYQPTAVARFAWELRYMDWVVTVPLLVIEFIAISTLPERAAQWIRRVGMISAIAMVVCGFLGAFIVHDGADLASYTILGVVGAVFFAVLDGLFVTTLRTTLPRLADDARRPYRSAVVVLLVTWLLYPIVYGFSGVLAGGAVVVVGQLMLSGADMIAKIGFGTLVHRTSVLRSRRDEDLDPAIPRRPRAPSNESVYVSDSRSLAFDDDDRSAF